MPDVGGNIYISENIPGLDKGIRVENPEYPANKNVVDKMNDLKFRGLIEDTHCTDCSDIAPILLNAAGGQGKIIEVRPLKPYTLNVFENGKKEEFMTYHQVYTDGQYVYDPRLSLQPIPKGDWEKHIKSINPDGVKISDSLQGLR